MFDVSAVELAALWQVLIIDLVLAGDNAIIVGLAAASVPAAIRGRVVAIGIALAVVMRIGFAVITVQLLEVPGVKLAGGLLLLWVCWRFLQDLRRPAHGPEQLQDIPGAADGEARKSLWRAVTQIVVADLSMSLDNVVAVASASGGYEWVLVVGLIVSVVLMAIAATFIARLLARHRWIAWAGFAVIVYVAIKMVWEGLADFHLIMPWPLV
jgi:YjbE family integral membrane protein